MTAHTLRAELRRRHRRARALAAPRPGPLNLFMAIPINATMGDIGLQTVPRVAS
jgi:hypothetical protein